MATAPASSPSARRWPTGTCDRSAIRAPACRGSSSSWTGARTSRCGPRRRTACSPSRAMPRCWCPCTAPACTSGSRSRPTTPRSHGRSPTTSTVSASCSRSSPPRWASAPARSRATASWSRCGTICRDDGGPHAVPGAPSAATGDGGVRVPLTLTRVAPDTYSLDPWPFATPHVDVRAEGRRLDGPSPDEPSLHAALDRAPVLTITARLQAPG
jgi:hypothetical protein